MAEAPTPRVPVEEIRRILKEAGYPDEVVNYATNLVTNALNKLPKYATRATVYREVNKALGPIYRQIKYYEGLKGADAWLTWHEIQRRALEGIASAVIRRD